MGPTGVDCFLYLKKDEKSKLIQGLLIPSKLFHNNQWVENTFKAAEVFEVCPNEQVNSEKFP